MSLRWKLRGQEDRLIVDLVGDLDETIDLRDLARHLVGCVALDLSGVRRISSSGVREWLSFLRSLDHVTDLALVGCSPASVTQLNLIDNFRGSARVESFWAPYVCEGCGQEREALLEAASVIWDRPPTWVRREHDRGDFNDDVERRGVPITDIKDVPGRAMRERVPAAPAVACDDCRRPMELDEIPERYFVFLADQPVQLGLIDLRGGTVRPLA